MTARLQFGAQFDGIVDCAIGDHPQRPVLVDYGLLSTTHAGDLQACATQSNTGIYINAEFVRATMPDHAQHPEQVSLFNRI